MAASALPLSSAYKTLVFSEINRVRLPPNFFSPNDNHREKEP